MKVEGKTIKITIPERVYEIAYRTHDDADGSLKDFAVFDGGECIAKSGLDKESMRQLAKAYSRPPEYNVENLAEDLQVCISNDFSTRVLTDDKITNKLERFVRERAPHDVLHMDHPNRRWND